jgi:hypothetical protein
MDYPITCDHEQYIMSQIAAFAQSAIIHCRFLFIKGAKRPESQRIAGKSGLKDGMRVFSCRRTVVESAHLGRDIGTYEVTDRN